MKKNYLKIRNIPAIIWGSPSHHVYFFVHGKMANKEDAQGFAEIATSKGFQVISFDLPEHGDRKNEEYPCNIQNSVHDLTIIATYAKEKWEGINLFACSLGAYFSLIAYNDMYFEKCLFLSPILDMEQLIKNMMKWSHVNEEQLKKEKEIDTPMGETLSWDYYTAVKNNPINKWDSSTYILYGTNDNLTERAVIDLFSKKYKSQVEFVDNGEHYFQSAEQIDALHTWLRNTI